MYHKYIQVLIVIALVYTSYSISLENTKELPVFNSNIYNNIHITHDAVNDQSVVTHCDKDTSDIWITFINHNSTNSMRSNNKGTKGIHPVILLDPFLYPGYDQENPMIMAYLTKSESSYIMNIEYSNDGGYTWNIGFFEPTPIDINEYSDNQLKLVLQIDRPQFNNNTRNWIVCYEAYNELSSEVGCYTSYNITYWDFNLINIPNNLCRDIIISPILPANYNLMMYCTDDLVIYKQRNYIITVTSFTTPPDVNILLIPDNNNVVDNNIFGMNNNIFYRTLTNKYVLASSNGLALETSTFNFTDYIVINNNTVRTILDLRNNSAIIYTDYDKADSSVNIYHTNDDMSSFVNVYNNILDVETDDEVIDITITSNYKNKIYVMFAVFDSVNNNIRYIIWIFYWEDLFVNNMILDTVLLPSISERESFSGETILYGDIVVDDELELRYNITIYINGNIVFAENSNTTIGKSSTIVVSDTAIFSGTLSLPSYNDSKPGDVIILISFNNSVGKFDNDNIDKDDECVNQNHHSKLEYTESALQVVFIPCQKEGETDNFMIVIISCGIAAGVFIIFLVATMVKFKDKIFIYRKRVKKIKEEKMSDYGSSDNSDLDIYVV